MDERKPHTQKIAVIGAGAVGATTAYTLMVKNLDAEIYLIDINDEKEKGEVMDINDGMSFSETSRVKSGDYKDAADADIIIMTAGVAQKPGETRLDLVDKNKAITTSVFKEIGELKQSAIVIVISNPVDIITYLVQEHSGLPLNQVFGTGTCLDTARLRSNLAGRFNLYREQIEGFVLGEHGNSEFVAWSTVSIGGRPANKFLEPSEMTQVEDEVRNEVYKIISSKGATFYGIAMAVTDIVEAILYDQNKILPVSSRLDNWNSVSGVSLGAPAVVGRGGIVKSWPVTLTAEEAKKLRASAETIKKYL